MRVKLDENLPESLITDIADFGHDVDNVQQEGLAGRADSRIWRAAQDSQRFFITQDLDFSDIRQFAPGTHYGLILLRLRLPGRSALKRRLMEIFTNEDVASWERCFVLVTDIKVRVHRPTA